MFALRESKMRGKAHRGIRKMYLNIKLAGGKFTTTLGPDARLNLMWQILNMRTLYLLDFEQSIYFLTRLKSEKVIM